MKMFNQVLAKGFIAFCWLLAKSCITMMVALLFIATAVEVLKGLHLLGAIHTVFTVLGETGLALLLVLVVLVAFAFKLQAVAMELCSRIQTAIESRENNTTKRGRMDVQ